MRKPKVLGQNYRINEAVNACIESGFLEDILKKNRGEVIQMILTEYDEELHIRTEKQNSYEDGMEAGKEEGICALIRTLIKLSISKEYIIEEIIEQFHLPMDEAADKVEKYWR